MDSGDGKAERRGAEESSEDRLVVPGGVYPAMYWSVALLESASLLQK